jgi:hypothetical protein
MTQEKKTQDADAQVECSCGCGVKIRPSVGLGRIKRYSSDACRVREWRRKHLRTIRNKRPRSKRANRGVEIQMDSQVLSLVDNLTQTGGFKSRSQMVVECIRSFAEIHGLWWPDGNDQTRQGRG